MRKYKRKFLSSLMCFVMGLSSGANAGAHQKKKSSSNESLTPAEWTVIFSTLLLGNELILKPLVGKLFSKGGNVDECDLNQIEEEKKTYIEKILNSIDTTVDESLKRGRLRTIPNSLGDIRKVLHCLFLWYSNENSEDIGNAKLTIGEKIDWSFTYGGENYVSSNDVRGILEWHRKNNNNFTFCNSLAPIEKFGFVIQKWAKEMGFKSVEIVMDGVGGYYASDHYKSSIKVKIHGFKYQLSDDERMSLMEKLGLEVIDTLEVFNDNEVIEIKG